MTFDTTTQSADVADVAQSTPITSERLLAVLARMSDNGGVQLAKASARVYLVTLRSVEKNKNAVYTPEEASEIIETLEFDRDDNGNNTGSVRYMLMYGTTNGATVKRLKQAVSSGAAADVEEALEKGLGKPPIEADSEPKAAGYLVQGNGQRIALTDIQYRAVMLILKQG